MSEEQRIESLHENWSTSSIIHAIITVVSSALHKLQCTFFRSTGKHLHQTSNSSRANDISTYNSVNERWRTYLPADSSLISSRILLMSLYSLWYTDIESAIGQKSRISHRILGLFNTRPIWRVGTCDCVWRDTRMIALPRNKKNSDEKSLMIR